MSIAGNESSRRIRAVVFDLDDTLYPEREYVRGGYRAVGRHLRDTYGCAVGFVRRTALFGEKADGDENPFAAWLWDRFRRGESAGAFDALNHRFGLGLDEARIAELVEVYRGHEPDIRPYEGVPRLLGRLRSGRRLGLLTDGYLPAQELKLKALRLDRFLDAVLFTERLGRDCWKPSPVGFETVRGELDVPHAACAYVADNPAKDFVAPNALGWRTIQFLRPDQIHAGNPAPAGGWAQHVVHDAGELVAALNWRD